MAHKVSTHHGVWFRRSTVMTALLTAVVAALLAAPLAAWAVTPESSIDGVPAGWVNYDVTFSLSSTVANHDSPPWINYWLNSGDQVLYTGPVTVAVEGVTDVKYQAQDGHLDVESPHHAFVRIDRTPPVTTIQVTPAGWMSATTSASFTLGAADGLSGIAATYYRIDGNTPVLYTGLVPVIAGDSHWIDYWSVDAAGNVEAMKSATVKRDLGGVPATGIQGLPVGWATSPVDLTLLAESPIAGHTPTTFYQVGGGSVNTGSGPIHISAQGTTAVTYWSVDPIAGTTESTRTANVRVDTIAPTCSINSIPATYSPSVTFSLSGADAVSGVAALRYSLNGGPAFDYTGPVTVTAQGDTPITYWAVDAAGNASAPQTAHALVDSAPPVTAISGVPANWTSADAALSFSAISARYHVTSTWVKVGSAAAVQYAGVPITVNSYSQVQFWSVDDRGLVETAQTAWILVDKTAPATTISGIPAGVSPGPVDFSLQSTDFGSGLAARYYRLNNGPTQTCAGPVTVSAPGTTTVTYWAVDTAGNVETVHTASIVIATSDAPVTTISGAPASWANGDVVFSLAATPGSAPLGQFPTSYSLNGGGALPYIGPVTVSAEGTTTVSYHSVDSLGHTEVAKTAIVRIDRTPPFTTCDAASTYPGSATVHFFPTDALSGVDFTVYTLDGGSPVTGTSVTVSDPGTHTVTYGSSDIAHNREVSKTATFRIAASGLPVTTITGVPAAWSASDVVFSLHASGPATITSTVYRLGSGGWTGYTAPVTISGEGTTVVSFYSADALGHVEAANTAVARVDKTPPVTTATVSPLPPGEPTATVRFFASDAMSGVAATYYLVDGGPQAEGTQTTVSGEGTHTVQSWSVDNAGNTEGRHQISFKILPRFDTLPPTLTKTPAGTSYTIVRHRGVAYWTCGITFATSAGVPVSGKPMRLLKSADALTWKQAAALTTDASGSCSVRLAFKSPGTGYWKWVFAGDTTTLPVSTSKTRVTVK